MPVVIGGDNLPSPVGIGLTNMPNIGEGVVIGGDNLLFPVGIGLTNLPNIGEGAVAPRFRHHWIVSFSYFLFS